MAAALEALGVRPPAPPPPTRGPAHLRAVLHGESMGWKPAYPGQEPPF
jgi:hypothetical protein